MSIPALCEKPMFVQLNPTIPVHVLDKGDGYAVAVIDYGQEHNLIWVTAITETGEIWCAPNPKVRVCQNWTMGRPPIANGPKVNGPKVNGDDKMQGH